MESIEKIKRMVSFFNQVKDLGLTIASDFKSSQHCWSRAKKAGSGHFGFKSMVSRKETEISGPLCATIVRRRQGHSSLNAVPQNALPLHGNLQRLSPNVIARQSQRLCRNASWPGPLFSQRQTHAWLRSWSAEIGEGSPKHTCCGKLHSYTKPRHPQNYWYVDIFCYISGIFQNACLVAW